MGGILIKNIGEGDVKVRRDKNTENGIYLEASERNRLAADGVHIMKLENCNNWGGVYEQHESFFNDKAVDSHWAFVRDLDNQPMIFDLQKTVTLPAGNYRLEIISQASAPGCFGYTVDSAGVYTNLVPLPAYVKDVTSNIGKTPTVLLIGLPTTLALWLTMPAICSTPLILPWSWPTILYSFIISSKAMSGHPWFLKTSPAI